MKTALSIVMNDKDVITQIKDGVSIAVLKRIANKIKTDSAGKVKPMVRLNKQMEPVLLITNPEEVRVVRKGKLLDRAIRMMSNDIS